MLARTVLRAATRPEALRQLQTTRAFRTTAVMRDATSAPARKPVGAFRGGLFGFLTGSVASGLGMYYYVLDDYKISNRLLTDDVLALQSAVSRIEGYVKVLEEKVDKK